MTVKAMIARLEKILAKHGDVEVFFDCPNCTQSFAPGTLATVAVHIDAKKAVPGD